MPLNGFNLDDYGEFIRREAEQQDRQERIELEARFAEPTDEEVRAELERRKRK